MHAKSRVDSESRIALVCSLLQRMGAAARRDVIQTRMGERERLALEAHVRSRGPRGNLVGAAAGRGTSAKPRVLAICDEGLKRAKGNGGIVSCKSSSGDRVIGYYATVAFNSLGLEAKVRKGLADALRDHITLVKIVEGSRGSDDSRDFPTALRASIGQVLQQEGLAMCDLLHAFTVSISAHHWTGRTLKIRSVDLETALVAWRRFDGIKRTALFAGCSIGSEYTPQRAQVRWKQIRETYIDMQLATGRANHRQAARRLSQLEASHRSTFVRLEAFNRRQHERRAQKSAHRSSPDTVLVQRCLSALRSWQRAEQRVERCRQRQAQAELRLKERCRWDGKESLLDFERRLRRCTGRGGAVPV